MYAQAAIRFTLVVPDARPASGGVESIAVPSLDTAPLPAGPLPTVDPDALAYLLFTSGSTGVPKGVEVTHGAAVNTVDALNHRFGVGPRDRLINVSALDFDLSVYDIFGALSAGATLVLIEDDTRRDASRWADLVRHFGVTVWQSVPALLDMLLTAAADGTGALPLRLALLGGDRVGPDLAGRLDAAAPGARLTALGGTTETAIHSTVQDVPVLVPAHWRSAPYGVPLANQRMRVVGPFGTDRPDWVPGELWIGGNSVARGYRGDPERTARQFVTHEGRRWYRTGDLARYWPDGTVEFLGRADFQVKLRGHRIEPGEVEAALVDHDEVTHAVALVVGDGPTRHLAAAVCLRPPATDTLPPTHTLPITDALRGHLAGRLPGYMVPTRITVLDAMPLSANGKIDRNRVRHLLDTGPAASPAAEPPEGAVEQAVARLWCRLLGRPAVGRADSFFALGGDSLVATRLLAALRADGLVGATLQGLFAEPVLRNFAAGLTLGVPAPARRALTADPAARYEPFPPTDVQRAYWMGRTDDFALGGVGSHWYWEFDGVDVDVDRLERAVNRLVERHDMLRAVFDADGRQRVLREVGHFTIPVDTGPAALTRLREVLSARVPDPARWPLIEIRAVRHGADRTRIGFSFDYIVLDALSIVTFFAELSALYRDEAAELAPLGVTFRDYLNHVDPPADVLAPAEAFWRGRLPELPAAPALPLVKDPATVRAARFHRREAKLDARQWTAITERARRHDVTPATVLAAAYAEVLSAWTGQDDLTLTFTLFHREPVHPDIQRILGDFTSLLLVAHHAEAGQSWLALVRRLQQQVWSAMQHAQVSAVWVLRELARREGVASVSMPVVFTSALGIAEELADLAFPFGELEWGVSQTPQVWLDNQVMERAGGLVVNWDGIDEMFPDGLLDAMFDAYRRLLAWLADNEWTTPTPTLLPAAQQAVRDRVNRTAGPLPERRLHEEFFDLARRHPDRPALLWDTDRNRRYGELADQALRIGAALVERGLRPAEPVAVTLPRGPDQIAAVLGILAAGGSYVPVGVEQPAARRARIYRRAGVRLVLTRQPAGPEPDAPTPLSPDVAAEPLAGPVPGDPDALAYTIFTSGSTGEPKGVQITHRAALNTVEDIDDRFGVGPDDRVLAVSALDFDLSVYDIFGPLRVGGGIVLVDPAHHREAAEWARLVRRWRVSVWNSVPALLDMLLVAADADGPLPDLRLVLVSGDWVGLDLSDRLRRLAAGARFVALGGATEAAIWSNAYEVDTVPAHWRSVPYGFPLRNQCYRVVDARGRDCPDWVAGELWIGGAGVALGYRDDPATTARQFVDRYGTRWYRTGDLGRYWDDGTLEFLGRRDFQVKIRGHRIELGEIETAAESHPGVARAVAVVLGEGPGRRLALAVVPAVAGEPADLPPDLGDLLGRRLPEYMVPEAMVPVSKLPLSGNGKVDRTRLTDRLRAALTGFDDAGEPPRGDTEKQLAALWSELLGGEIGRNRNFFALGGDSLLATRLVELLRRRHGVALTLRQLFTAPTVAQLAALLDTGNDGLRDGNLEEGTI
jgi:amino acid adenylation domain-containing protein